MTARDQWNSDVALDIIKPHLGQEGALLPILHALQEAFGHIPDLAVPMVAEALNLSRAEVHGVVTFYHDFRQRAGRTPRGEALPGGGLPGGRRRCACRARASQARREHWAIPRADGSVTLEPVYCLGLCADRAVGDDRRPRRRHGSTEQRLDALLAEAQSMTLRVYIPRDAAAVSVGADEVAAAFEAAAGRAASRSTSFAPARAGCIGSSRWSNSRRRIRARRLWPGCGERRSGAARRDFIGRQAAPAAPRPGGRHPWLKRQTRLTFARCGIVDPLSLDDYRAHGGCKGLARALSLGPAAHHRRGRAIRTARPRRRRLPDRHQVAHRGGNASRRRSTSSATPTRATAARSPIA